MAGRRGAAPRPLGFGGPAAQLVRDLFDVRVIVAQAVVDLNKAACRAVVFWTQADAQSAFAMLRRGSLHFCCAANEGWREAILLLNHNRGN